MQKNLPKLKSKTLKLSTAFFNTNNRFAIYGTEKGHSVSIVPRDNGWAIFSKNRRKCSGLIDNITAIKVCDFLSCHDML